MTLRCDECGNEINTPFGPCPHCGYSGLGGGETPPQETVLVILHWNDFCVTCGVEHGVRMRDDGFCYCSRCWQVRNG